jgi:hypothetical protein
METREPGFGRMPDGLIAADRAFCVLPPVDRSLTPEPIARGRGRAAKAVDDC